MSQRNSLGVPGLRHRQQGADPGPLKAEFRPGYRSQVDWPGLFQSGQTGNFPIKPIENQGRVEYSLGRILARLGQQVLGRVGVGPRDLIGEEN